MSSPTASNPTPDVQQSVGIFSSAKTLFRYAVGSSTVYTLKLGLIVFLFWSGWSNLISPYPPAQSSQKYRFSQFSSLPFDNPTHFGNKLRRTTKNYSLRQQVKWKFKSKLWEENAGTLTLAKLEPGRMTPRSTHYGIKYHWFRTKVKKYEVELLKIGTEEQLAAILTKGLFRLIGFWLP